MKIKSPAFNHNEMIPKKYTCAGEDISPPLEIIDVPDEAESLALIMDDPDAPGRTWVHWVVWNIDPKTTKIEEDSVPEGANVGVNTWEKPEYGGPCPPKGKHRYFFKLYALKEKLDIGKFSTKEELMEEVNKYQIEKAQLVGLFKK